MKTRLFLLTTVFSLCFYLASAQNCTEFAHGTDAPHGGWCIIETMDGNLLLSVDKYEADGNMKDHILYRFTRDGALIDSLALGLRECKSYLLERDPNPDDDTSYLFGYTYSNEGGSSIFRLLKLDDYLSIVDAVDVVYSDGDGLYAKIILDTAGDIVMYWKSDDNKGNLARIDLDGTVRTQAKFDLYSEHCYVDRTALNMYDEESKEYSVVYTTGLDYPETIHVITVYDSLFNLVASKEMSLYDGLYVDEIDAPCLRGYGDRRMLFFRGDYFGGYSGSWYHCLELAEVQGLDQVLRRYLFKSPQLEGSYHSGFDPFVMAKDGGFYMVAFRSQVNNPMRVFKIGSDLTLEWERWCLEPYTPTTFQVCMDMCALEDGGVALCGTESDFEYPRQRFWVVTFTDEGTGIGEAAESVRPYLIYPNPVKDRLSIQFSPDVKPESIELYDIAGRCVASSRTAEMNVADLPAGQYIAKITLEGGKVYSDKVVKK